MSSKRDDMVITPRIKPRSETGPRRRAREAKRNAKVKGRRGKLLKKLRNAQVARKMAAARKAHRSAAAARAAKGAASAAGKKVASRFLGPVGVALLVMDVVNYAGGVVRRAEGGVSGRLLDAQDNHDKWAGLDIDATAAKRTRAAIGSNDRLIGIIGLQHGANGQIAEAGAWLKERETAIAVGSDLIEREPDFDHMETIMDKTIAGFMDVVKTSADSGIDAVKEYFGGSTEAGK